MDLNNNDIIYVYILAPITVIVAVGVITYISIQSRRLKKEMMDNGMINFIINKLQKLMIHFRAISWGRTSCNNCK